MDGCGQAFADEAVDAALACPETGEAARAVICALLIEIERLKQLLAVQAIKRVIHEENRD